MIDEHNTVFWVDDKYGNNIICIPLDKLMKDGYVLKVPLKLIGAKFRITTEGKHER